MRILSFHEQALRKVNSYSTKGAIQIYKEFYEEEVYSRTRNSKRTESEYIKSMYVEGFTSELFYILSKDFVDSKEKIYNIENNTDYEDSNIVVISEAMSLKSARYTAIPSLEFYHDNKINFQGNIYLKVYLERLVSDYYDKLNELTTEKKDKLVAEIVALKFSLKYFYEAKRFEHEEKLDNLSVQGFLKKICTDRDFEIKFHKKKTK